MSNKVFTDHELQIWHIWLERFDVGGKVLEVFPMKLSRRFVKQNPHIEIIEPRILETAFMASTDFMCKHFTQYTQKWNFIHTTRALTTSLLPYAHDCWDLWTWFPHQTILVHFDLEFDDPERFWKFDGSRMSNSRGPWMNILKIVYFFTFTLCVNDQNLMKNQFQREMIFNAKTIVYRVKVHLNFGLGAKLNAWLILQGNKNTIPSSVLCLYAETFAQLGP